MEKLKQLYLDYDKIKHPTFPDAYRSFPNFFKSSNTTNGLTNCIISYIKLNGWQAERISTTGRHIDNTKIVKDVLGYSRKIGSIEYIKGTGTKGSADISATINGKSVKIEVKNEKTKDRMSKEQKEYQLTIDLTGGIYYVAKNFNDFRIWFDANFEKNIRYLEFYKTIKI